jgi:hypothetical protein
MLEMDRGVQHAITMGRHYACVTAVAATLVGCASAPAQPAQAPERGAFCPVTVQNGTSYVLDITYGTRAQRTSLGQMSPGESVDVSVPCDDRYVRASGVAQVVSAGRGFLQFQRSMEIAVQETTKLTLRSSDQQR